MDMNFHIGGLIRGLTTLGHLKFTVLLLESTWLIYVYDLQWKSHQSFLETRSLLAFCDPLLIEHSCGKWPGHSDEHDDLPSGNLT